MGNLIQIVDALGKTETFLEKSQNDKDDKGT